jgi:hypothetical protein
MCTLYSEFYSWYHGAIGLDTTKHTNPSSSKSVRFYCFKWNMFTANSKRFQFVYFILLHRINNFCNFFKFLSSKGHGQIVKTAVPVEVYRVIPIEAYVHAHNIVSCKIL